jgi:hypothetical protein
MRMYPRMPDEVLVLTWSSCNQQGKTSAVTETLATYQTTYCKGCSERSELCSSLAVGIFVFVTVCV